MLGYSWKPLSICIRSLLNNNSDAIPQPYISRRIHLSRKIHIYLFIDYDIEQQYAI